MSNDLRITTTFTPVQITQEITGPEIDWRTMTREVISREVMQLKDEGVREALIKLGWTPPANPTDGTNMHA